LAFLDEDEALPASDPPVRERRTGPPPRQQIVVRRLIAAAAGVLLLILVVLGVKGCLDARHERDLKDYVRNVGSLTAESKQISDSLFGLLNDPKNLTPLDYEAEIKSGAAAAENLVNRVDHLGVPGGMGKAQEVNQLAFELRANGLQQVADQVSAALGKEGRAQAIQNIADAMQSFLASDVIYAKLSVPEMNRVLQSNGIHNVAVPQSKFLPLNDWLQSTKVADALGRVSGSSTATTPGVHGLGLVQTTANPGGVVLQPDTDNTLSASGTPELVVQVQNQGESEETDVSVSATVSGGSSPIDLSRTIPRIGPGETADVTIPVSPKPPSGSNLTIEVSVQPVPGETVSDNNKSTYRVTYG
jgi:hypothetical protein